MLLQLKFLFSLYLSLLSWLHSGAYKKSWCQSERRYCLNTWGFVGAHGLIEVSSCVRTPRGRWADCLLKSPSQQQKTLSFNACYSYLPPSISSPQVIEVPLQKSRFCWREIVPSATTHIALQSITHHFCFSPPLWKSLLLMLRAFQCHPLGSDTGGDWVLEFFLLCCLQTHLYSAPMAYLVLPLGWHNLHKFSVLYEYSPYFVLSSFFFLHFPPILQFLFFRAVLDSR